MASMTRIALQKRLLDDWQRGLPLERRPFAAIAAQLGVRESDVIAGLQKLKADGTIARVGGVVRPNTLGCSTLFAMQVPDLDVSATAELLTAEPGVNHVYLRENERNLWSVATGPDADYVADVLRRIAQRTGRTVLDLRLERPFHIDLGFALNGESGQHAVPDMPPGDAQRARYAPQSGDRELAQILTLGLPLHPRPFREIADTLRWHEDDVIARIKILADVGILPRIGVIVRHRALGWRSNAMVVWDVPPDDIERAGHALAASPGINLCYQRTRYADAWPYNLYCMVHAKSRGTALSLLEDAERQAGLTGLPRQVLFSLRCYKQTGALITRPRVAA